MLKGPNVASLGGNALSRDCSIAEWLEIDVDLFRSDRVAIGTFRCPRGYPAFRDTGAIEEHLVVFPRTSVWIQHEGSRTFLADPNVITLYNRSQRYQRFPASPEGDHSDWLSLSDDVAREIAGVADERVADAEQPFSSEWIASSADLYLRQRALIGGARRGELDALEAEEEVMAIAADVLQWNTSAVAPRARRSVTVAAHRDLADHARALINATACENRSVDSLARALGTTPWHLCRVFRACTGRTMHEYRNELRLRLSLDLLETHRHASLSAIALELGFASHSHFVRVARRHARATPSALRARLVAKGDLS